MHFRSLRTQHGPTCDRTKENPGTSSSTRVADIMGITSSMTQQTSTSCTEGCNTVGTTTLMVLSWALPEACGRQAQQQYGSMLVQPCAGIGPQEDTELTLGPSADIAEHYDLRPKTVDAQSALSRSGYRMSSPPTSSRGSSCVRDVLGTNRCNSMLPTSSSYKKRTASRATFGLPTTTFALPRNSSLDGSCGCDVLIARRRPVLRKSKPFPRKYSGSSPGHRS